MDLPRQKQPPMKEYISLTRRAPYRDPAAGPTRKA